MKVAMLLADHAQVVGNKLYILGGGWSIIGPGPTAMAIALKVEVPWDEANRRHKLVLDLLDEDGQPVKVSVPMPGGADQTQTLRIEGEFEAGRPAGLKPGTPLDVAVALNLPPVQLPQGRRLVWRLTIDGDTEEAWQLSFTTREPQAP